MTEFEIKALRVEVERLRTENAKLHRNAGRQSAFIGKLRRAHDDAVLFLSLRAGGITPSREYCADTLGIGRRRWQWAMALLRLAKLINRDPADPASLDLLERAKSEALDNPLSLKVRLTRHGRDVWSRVNRVRQSRYDTC